METAIVSQEHQPGDPFTADAGARMTNQVIAVTNRHLCSRPLAEQVERICFLHPKAVILREKDLSESDYQLLAKEIMKICKSHNVPCVLHTYIKAAKELHGSAIHLPFPIFREHYTELGSFAEAGTSVHSLEEALEAERLGATYLIAGHIYATDCKKGLPPRGPEFLRTVCQNVKLPIYAIGGIKLESEQLREVINCGAKGGCIMSGMMEI